MKKEFRATEKQLQHYDRVVKLKGLMEKIAEAKLYPIYFQKEWEAINELITYMNPENAVIYSLTKEDMQSINKLWNDCNKFLKETGNG